MVVPLPSSLSFHSSHRESAQVLHHDRAEEKIRLKILSIVLGFACAGDAVQDMLDPWQRARAHRMRTLQHGVSSIGAVDNCCPPHASLCRRETATSVASIARTLAMGAGITAHGGTGRELLSFHVPPPRGS